MSQHHQRTQHGPSLVSILALGALALAVIVAAYWIVLSGPSFDSRHLGGAILGLLLALSVFAQCFGRIVERRIAQGRIRRARDNQRAAQEEQISKRAATTGTWENEHGKTLTIRFDPDTLIFYAHGHMGPFWTLTEETEWTWGKDTLSGGLAERETTGEITAWHDEGTRTVRKALGLADWPDPVAPVPLTPPMRPDTQVAVPQVRMEAPGFLSEAERAVWYHHTHHEPTRVIRLA